MSVLVPAVTVIYYVEGKLLMSEKPGEFNKAASRAYNKLSVEERTSLENEAAEGKFVPFKKKDILSLGRKLFGKIQNCVRYNKGKVLPLRSTVFSFRNFRKLGMLGLLLDSTKKHLKL